MDSPAIRSRLQRLLRPDPTGGGRFSTTFSQPLGRHVSGDGTGGFYLDLTVKAQSPRWPPSLFVPGGGLLWVGVIQWALGCHERYLDGEGEPWLAGAIAAADRLVADQRTSGPQAGGWAHEMPYPHTFRLEPPWLSAIAQGEGASLLVRIGDATGEDRYFEAAARALAPLRVPSRAGGVAALLDGGLFAEEYPTDPPSYVLNGNLFSLWGCHDVAQRLSDARARDLLAEGVETMRHALDRFDLGYWSRYDLYPHRLVNVASPAYHRLHIDQLRATARITGEAFFADRAARFESYERSVPMRLRALARKAAFRVAVPRRGFAAGRNGDPGGVADAA